MSKTFLSTLWGGVSPSVLSSCALSLFSCRRARSARLSLVPVGAEGCPGSSSRAWCSPAGSPAHLDWLKVDFCHLLPDFYFHITGGIALFKHTLLSDPHRAQILKNVFLELNQYMSRKKIQGELGVASWMETENHLALQASQFHYLLFQL